jgi:hypothetical protein
MNSSPSYTRLVWSCRIASCSDAENFRAAAANVKQLRPVGGRAVHVYRRLAVT